MRVIPSAIRASLERGATTFARCWSIARTDGAVLGFTDHDRDLAFEGIVFEAGSGLTAEAIESSLGLSVDTHSVRGALSSEIISEADIDRGFFDGAAVTMWLVDWTNVSSRLLLLRGNIGEIRRRGGAFEAEVASLAEKLNQPTGRAFLHSCDRRLGDALCGIDLSRPEFRDAGVVSAVIDAQRFVVSGIEGRPRGWFDGGELVWTSGANAGVRGQVKTHLATASGATLELWLTPPMPLAPGDGLAVTAGCDKTLETCRVKFDNILNFRGFPHMPGDDWVSGYVAGEGDHDGGSLLRR